MNESSNDFELLQQKICEIVGEAQTFSITSDRLREALKAECSRAETAEASRDAALRALEETRADLAAAAASASHLVAALAKVNDEQTSTKMQLELVDRHTSSLEAKTVELSTQLSVAERDVQQLRGVQSQRAALQQQYVELQGRVKVATEEATREVSRLETELRRVERCATSGKELRERARLAGAAHARERRLADAELKDTAIELRNAKIEIVRLSNALADAQCKLAQESSNRVNLDCKTDSEVLAEVRAALTAERSSAATLERTLASAVATNSELTALISAADCARAARSDIEQPFPLNSPKPSNISAVDSFLAD